MSSGDSSDISSDSESDTLVANLVEMGSYESTAISELTDQMTETKTLKESPEELQKKIETLKRKLLHARRSGSSEKKIQELEEQLAEAQIRTQLPENLDGVDLQLASANNDEALPEVDDELNKYWHYKVLHTAFAGEDSIDLTIDDSEQDMYKNRRAFIRDHCEPFTEFHELEGGLKVAMPIWKSLFPHQRAAIEWAWGLWQQEAGGIEGDEMGLGKTAICCVFLGALANSGFLKKPVLVLCPLTVTQQWIRECHVWCPELRAVLLHSTRSNKNYEIGDILRDAEDTPMIIVTNYETLNRSDSECHSQIELMDWGAVLCDEGHKIRNHESQVARSVKKLTADFRLAISGSPIQNSLEELWSLFDFAYPGLLGALDVFVRDFAAPIKEGGYKNASSFVVYRAYAAAVSLRDMIKPYLLRRLKRDVQAKLPGKTEQIFFVNLTDAQLREYQDFLNSHLFRSILSGQAQCFIGIDHLRKICNHPVLLKDAGSTNGKLEHSAKLKLLKKLLPEWHKQGHRPLLFSQYLGMLDLVGQLMESLGLTYFRIDGDTSAGNRQTLIDRFNAGERYGCLLSTRVGGVGVNLTGADRVVIVDPDWNPSTDNQALERAWRIGQTKDVCVYRLITAGTIEEKMYKKQIFKQFLSNKILQSPNQRRMFQPQTLYSLFKLDTVDELKEELTDNEDEPEEEGTGDKDIMEQLCQGGDIQRVFNHDDLFGDNRGTEDIINEKRANRENEHAVEALKRRGPEKKDPGSINAWTLLKRFKTEDGDDDATEKITKKLIKWIKEQGGIVATKDVQNRFSSDPDVESGSIFKQILRRISVLDKKTHTWTLKHKFMKN